MKSKNEIDYTSSGIKYFKHIESLQSYSEKTGRSIISTHISPEGKCNLKCSYCCMDNRKRGNRLLMETIEEYVNALCSRGLKAVVLTGGGEPTLYPQINELIEYLSTKNLQVGIITNGTQLYRLSEKSLKHLEWIRVSINVFDGFEKKIIVPKDYLKNDCVIGFSFVCTSKMLADTSLDETMKLLRTISKMADENSAKYIRIIPDSYLNDDLLKIARNKISSLLVEINDDRYFLQQNKKFNTPKADVCHASYFRPFLSEVAWDGVPGTVFPCDSVSLLNDSKKLSEEYRLCKPSEILSYLDHKIEFPFKPSTACTRCVYFQNINMLDDYFNKLIDAPDINKININHENFV